MDPESCLLRELYPNFRSMSSPRRRWLSTDRLHKDYLDDSSRLNGATTQKTDISLHFTY